MRRYVGSAQTIRRASTRPFRIAHVDDLTVETFRRNAFVPAVPCTFAKGSFASIPARSAWFEPKHNDNNGATSGHGLRIAHLTSFARTVVPLELTTFKVPVDTLSNLAPQVTHFERFEAPLSYFLDYPACAADDEVKAQHDDQSTSRVWNQLYLAQCPIASLDPAMRAELPVPDLVLEAGKGDVYDSSIWIGASPTYTPLHKDPNPNLFVQLVGTKKVRLCEPALGAAIFYEVQRRLGRGGASASMRGYEMMQGSERVMLEDIVWNDRGIATSINELMTEVTLDSGDGLFIPKGWWHSVKGIEPGILGSVNWWFR